MRTGQRIPAFCFSVRDMATTEGKTSSANCRLAERATIPSSSTGWDKPLTVDPESASINYKGRLQEVVQQQGFPLPAYSSRPVGTAYWVSVVAGPYVAEAIRPTRRLAEQAAAASALSQASGRVVLGSLDDWRFPGEGARDRDPLSIRVLEPERVKRETATWTRSQERQLAVAAARRIHDQLGTADSYVLLSVIEATLLASGIEPNPGPARDIVATFPAIYSTFSGGPVDLGPVGKAATVEFEIDSVVTFLEAVVRRVLNVYIITGSGAPIAGNSPVNDGQTFLLAQNYVICDSTLDTSCVLPQTTTSRYQVQPSDHLWIIGNGVGNANWAVSIKLRTIEPNPGPPSSIFADHESTEWSRDPLPDELPVEPVVGVWFRVVRGGKCVPEEQVVARNIEAMAKQAEEARSSHKAVSRYMLGLAAFEREGRAIGGPFATSTFDAMHEFASSDKKRKNQIVNQAKKKIFGGAAPKRREEKDDEANFTPNADAAKVRKIANAINDASERLTQSASETLCVVVASGAHELISLLAAKLSSFVNHRASSYDDVIRRWWAGGYPFSSDMLRDLATHDRVYAHLFPPEGGIDSLTGAPFTVSRVAAIWAGSSPAGQSEIGMLGAGHSIGDGPTTGQAEIGMLGSGNSKGDGPPSSAEAAMAPASSENATQIQGGSLAPPVAPATPSTETAKLARLLQTAYMEAVQYNYPSPAAPTVPAINAARIMRTRLKQFEASYSQTTGLLTEGEHGYCDTVYDNGGVPAPIVPTVGLVVEPNAAVRSEVYAIDSAGTQMLTAANAKDLALLSNPLRTNNTRVNMQAAVAAIAYMKGLFIDTMGGMPLSVVPLYLRCLLKILSRLPLFGRGTPVGNQTFQAAAGGVFAPDAGAFPMSPAAAAGNPVINAVFTDLDTYVNFLLANTGANVAQGYSTDFLDQQTVVIPITNELLADPVSLAAYITCFLEHPFTRGSYAGNVLNTVAGAPAVLGGANWRPYSDYVRVPGVTTSVILLYLPGSVPNGTVLQVGAQAVAYAANFAAPVNIGTALRNVEAAGSASPYYTAYQYLTRIFGIGLGHDVACELLTDVAVRWRRPVTVRGDPANLGNQPLLSGAVVGTFGGAPAFQQGLASWVVPTGAGVSALASDVTTSMLSPGYSDAVCRTLQSCVHARVGFFNSQAGVLAALNFAAPATTSRWRAIGDMGTFTQRVHEAAAFRALRADLLTQTLNLPAEAIYNFLDMPAEVQTNYRSYISYLGAERASERGKGASLYAYLNAGLKGYELTCIPILSHTNNVTAALFQQSDLTPVARLDQWRTDELSADVDQVDLPCEGTSDGSALCGGQLPKTIDLGGGNFIRWIDRVDPGSGDPRARKVRNGLNYGYWDDIAVNMFVYVPDGRAAAVVSVPHLTDLPDEAVALRIALANFGTLPIGAVTYREMLKLPFRPSMRMRDQNTVGVGVAQNSDYFYQKLFRIGKPVGMITKTMPGRFTSNASGVGGSVATPDSSSFAI